MKKVTLVVMDRERENALLELRRLGVMHLETKPVASPELSILLEQKAKAESANGLLLGYPVSKKSPALSPAGRPVGDSVISGALSLLDEKKTLQEALSADRKDISLIESWGDFEPSDIEQLRAAGVELSLWEIDRALYESLGSGVLVIPLGRSKGKVRLVALGAPLGQLPSRIGEAVPVTLPGRSLAALLASVKAAEDRLCQIEVELAALAPHRGSVREELVRIVSAIEFEAARLGMEKSADGPEPLSIAWLSGFVPAADLGRLKRAAMEHGWALLADDPRDDELPPTKVKNGALVRIIQPVFTFLGIIPNYREYDISIWFLLFFSIFFAMIFGDAGYGSILFAVALATVLKARLRGKAVPDMARLLVFLSALTIVWGAITLSWFGIAPGKLPSFLQRLDVYWLSNANPESSDNIKLFCFILGTVQLVIAHAKNIRRDRGSLKVLAQFGQMAMVIGMMNLVLNLVISPSRFPLPTWAIWSIATGFCLNFMFASYEAGGNPIVATGKSILSSLTNVISMFLGLVNVFADIISYIRLWAVGLAGVAISQTVNGLVEPLLGHFALFLVGAGILLFGHGLNIMMSFLSVIVHGVRLNVLEFSSHLGMEWSGYSYEPFREKGSPDQGTGTNTISSKELS